MKIKFFRKLNALSIKNAKTRVPTNEELIENLVKKLAEKVYHMEVIYTKNLRDGYLKKKNKYEYSLSLSEDKIKSLLAERLAVDFLQLFVDISKFYNIENTSKTPLKTKTETQIKEELEKLIPNLLTPKNVSIYIQQFYDLFESYCAVFEFDIEKIKRSQQQIQEAEGSFFEGLFVIFEQ